MSVNKKLIGSRIQTLRKEKQLRQKDVADALGLTDQYISKIERGDTSMTLNTLSGIADCLGVDLGMLVGGANSASPDYGKHEVFAIMDKATPKQKDAIVAHAKIVIKT